MNVVAHKPMKSTFDVKIRTDKKNYEIGNDIEFYITSDKSGFLTVLNINSDGNVCVLFPNFNGNNFIRAGETKKIPPEVFQPIKRNKRKEWTGFKLKIEGPPGLERIKAFVTPYKNSLMQMNLSKEKPFYCIQRETFDGDKFIRRLSINLDVLGETEWSEAYSEIFIFQKGEQFKQGSRTIPRDE